MSSNNRLAAIAHLRTRIREYDAAYYGRGQSLISDREYDALYKELADLEAASPELISPDSPTQRVGNDLSTGFAKVKHYTAMMSIDNTYSEADLRSWNERLVKDLGARESTPLSFNGTLKMDGVAISLHYHEGTLIKAVTRGDGATGDDVTVNVRTIRSIPLAIDHRADLEIRGEIYLAYADFEALNRRLSEEGEKPMQNPRNTAAGTLKLLDPKEVSRRSLSFAAYHAIGDGIGDTHLNALHYLSNLGFQVVSHSDALDSIDAVIAFVNSWEEKRDTVPFPVDGVVIKVDNSALQERLGTTARSPRWAIAYKYKPRTAITRLLAIDSQVGRTGVITPVAKLEPVLLAGTTIQNATLHNFEEIGRLDVREGDFVEIEKGGEIIPKILRVVLEKRDPALTTFQQPAQCPSCGSALVKENESVALRCPASASCPAQFLASLTHFVSRQAMNCESIGPALAEQLIRAGLVHSVADLYELTEENFAGLERMGPKSARNVIEALNRSRQVPLDRLLFGLGIRMVGAQSARAIAQSVTDIADLYTMDQEKLKNIELLGEETAKSIRIFFDNPLNRTMIERLRSSGLNLKGVPQAEVAAGTSPFSGAIVVITGTLEQYSRDEAADVVMRQGGKVSGSVSKKTTFVLAGTEAGSKLTKAKELGVRIIDEGAFEQMLKQGPADTRQRCQDAVPREKYP